MQVHCLKEELLRGVQLVQNAISPRSTLPVLSNILMESTGEGLRMSSTDLEVGIRCFVKADVKTGGATTVPARTLGEFLRTLDDGQDLDIKVDESQKMEIRSGKDRCVLMGLPKDDYPVLPEFSQERAFSVNQNTLREMIRKTSFAVSTDETRYVLNGVDFIVDKGKITLVSTDGRRLAYVQRDCGDKKAVANAIIPTKAVNELARILTGDEKDGVVQIGFTENQVTFNYKGTVVLSRLIEGHFPNFEQVIPKSHDSQIKFNTRKLLLATQRAAVGTLEKGGSVRYSLTKGKLQISASAQGRVEVESELEAAYTGAPFAIAFNPAYLVDMFRVLETDDVLLELTTPLNPAVIRPVGDEHYKYVVMPMQLT
ncbi:MAG TPA: DNA polymerase III subunit beta [Elusimicrobiota bacterium]|nr:DNA polymerase III subunit beta [Elusimicrobiota bacterium]